MTRAHYLMLAALSSLASASIFMTGALVFGVVAYELDIGLPTTLFVPLLPAVPLIVIAHKFFRKAKTQHATEQVAV